MGINFGNLDTSVPTPTEVAPAPAGISLNLEKNTILDLAKASPGLKKRFLELVGMLLVQEEMLT